MSVCASLLPHCHFILDFDFRKERLAYLILIFLLALTWLITFVSQKSWKRTVTRSKDISVESILKPVATFFWVIVYYSLFEHGSHLQYKPRPRTFGQQKREKRCFIDLLFYSFILMLIIIFNRFSVQTQKNALSHMSCPLEATLACMLIVSFTSCG
jgi:uncharacterized SAM-binding protein YcdF (DUF218 family)